MERGEQHELQPSVSRNERSMSLAVSTPLPESTESSLHEDLTRNSLSGHGIASEMPMNAIDEDQPSSKPQTYMEKIEKLSLRFPHLRRVWTVGDSSKVLVDCYDFYEGLLESLRTFSNNSNASTFLSDEGENLEDTLRCAGEGNLDTRLLIVTDLSKSLIEFLGSHFQMNPEFFAEHLLYSRQGGDYKDQEPHSWTTRSMVKDYSSIKWYRPVKGNEKLAALTEDDRQEMASSGKFLSRIVPNYEQNSRTNRLTTKHRYLFDSNIVRGQWEFEIPRTIHEKKGTILSGWEERATMWSRTYEDHMVGEYDQEIPTKTKYLDKLVVVLMDPLPIVVESVSGKHEAIEKGGYANQGFSVTDNEGADEVTVTLPPYCLFRQFEPRCPPISYHSIMAFDDPSVTREVDHAFFTTAPTAQDLQQWLKPLIKPTDTKARSQLYPLECLFSIIEKDMLDFLYIMDIILKELAQDFQNETQIRRRLSYWRGALGIFESQLTAMEDYLQGYASFLTRLTCDKRPITMHQTPFTGINLARCSEQISICRHQTHKSSKLLMANITILESKRGIAEAESVARLTELAFFFIPLTFSASIFSMQVKELSSPDLSISAFFALAVSLTASAYLLRLLIRSSLYIDLWHKLLDSLREFANLPAGSPIPTRAVLIWFPKRLKESTSQLRLLGAISCMVGTVVGAILLITLWSRPLQRGLKVASTLSILSLLIPLLGYLILSLCYPRKRKASIDDDR